MHHSGVSSIVLRELEHPPQLLHNSKLYYKQKKHLIKRVTQAQLDCVKVVIVLWNQL